MKKLLLSLILLLSISPCFAQGNPQCPTRPVGDSTNACASTAFVQGAFAVFALPQNQIFVGNASNVATAVAMSQDCTIVSSGVITCTSTNNVPFAPSATTDTTNATNISSGTLAAARMAAFGSGDVSFATAGGAGTIAANAVTNAKLATMPANTAKVNATSGVAVPTNFAMPSCSAAQSALIWTTNTGFGCNTLASGGTVTSVAQDTQASVTLSTNPCTTTCTVGVGSGNRKLLNTLTASNSITLPDTSSFTGTFTKYVLVFENLLPVTNTVQLELQVHSAGSFQATTYLATATLTSIGAALASVSPTTFIALSNTNVANTGPGLSGEVYVETPTGTAFPKTWWGSLAYPQSTNSGGRAEIVGFWNGSNGALDGFQVLASSGNLASGTIKVYGIVN